MQILQGLFGRFLLCCVWIGLDWIQFLGHQLDWTGLGSMNSGFGLDWILATQSIPYSAPNRPKRARSRDKTAGSLLTRVYTSVEFSQTKRCFLLVFKTKHTKTNDTSTSLSLTQHNSYFVKNKIFILLFLFFCLFCLRSTNAIERSHWL